MILLTALNQTLKFKNKSTFVNLNKKSGGSKFLFGDRLSHFPGKSNIERIAFKVLKINQEER